MMENKGCALTGGKATEFSYDPLSELVDYRNILAGRVRMRADYYQTLFNEYRTTNYLHVGYCREQNEKGEVPATLDDFVVADLLETWEYPRTLEERANHLLNHLYNRGGKEGQEISLLNSKDYPLCYGENFRVLDDTLAYLESGGSLSLKKSEVGGHSKSYRVRIPRPELQRMGANLSHGLLQGLTSQRITVGEGSLDKRIAHAMKLFNQPARTLETSRSAVLELCAVAEFMRADLLKEFGQKDTGTFFDTVNNFDVRHNKERTMKIQHVEQLEWLFYGFLNTINTCAKMKQKSMVTT